MNNSNNVLPVALFDEVSCTASEFFKNECMWRDLPDSKGFDPLFLAMSGAWLKQVFVYSLAVVFECFFSNAFLCLCL